MEIERKILVSRPLNEVWYSLSDEFGEVAKWNTQIEYSRLHGTGKLLGLNYASRILETAEGESEEVMTTHEAKTHSLSYRCKTGLPIQIRKVSTNWSMTNTMEGTEVRMILNIQLSIIGLFMYPFVLYKQGEEASRIMKEFKEYLEA